MKDGSLARIKVELVDIYVEESGSKRVLPLGASPFTAEGLVVFPQNIDSYTPSAEFQYFEVPFRFKKKATIDRPVMGGLRISLQTEDEQTGAISVNSAVVGTFAFLPKGAGLNTKPGIKLSDYSLSRSTQDFFPFNLIPDLPFLYNSGPIQSKFVIENTGDIFLEVISEVSVKPYPVLGLGASAALFTQTSEALLFLPGQLVQKSVAIENTPQGALPMGELGIGLYEITTSITGSLGEDIYVADIQSYWYVIFPWKYISAILALLLFFRKAIVRQVKKALNFASKFRDFLKAQRLAASKVNALAKPTHSQELDMRQGDSTTPVLQEKARQPLATTSPMVAPIAKTPNNLQSNEPRPLYPTWYQPKRPQTDSSKNPNARRPNEES